MATRQLLGTHQDTFDLRDQILTDDHNNNQQGVLEAVYHSDEEHSMLEDDSDGEDRDDYMDDDDGSSSLSIPNESIDFDLVYALHSFAATVEGQANVVKGDSLFLMDDSNSYWWLVRVLKTQEVGYIPAENIETPFERLARLNKHRNVDLASATPAEMRDALDPANSRERLHANTARVATPSPLLGQRGVAQATARRSIAFTPSLSVHRYPPAVWNEDEEEEDDETEWDLEGYEDEDPDLADEQAQMESQLQQMEPDDGMSWEDGAVEEMQRQNQATASVLKPLRPVEAQEQPRSQPPIQQVAFPTQQPTSEISPTLSTSSNPSDPALATETRRLTVTPPVARDPTLITEEPVQRPQPAQAAPLLPSAIMAQQEAERKRTREEIEALEAAQKKARNKITADQQRPQSGGKLRKDRSEPEEDTKEKKRGGLFGIFGRRKDKSSKSGTTSSNASLDSSSDLRISDDSSISVSNQQHDGNSPTTASARQQQQQQILQQQATHRNSSADSKRAHSSPTGSQDQISQHASQLRDYDLQQQKLFHEYLTRSPSSPPEASYGLASAPLMPYSQSFSSSTSSTNNLSPVASRPRPGSLILAPSTTDGQGVGVPDLSVVRIFAGKHVQTEATFKTVLLNSSTTSSDLVKQALQRFRLPAGEDASQYYLSMKQLEGSFAILRPEETPLGVFESLVEAAMELPRVKRSSVGSISSVSSNLSMHPAIKKLAMNDFTDDSAVKFYLNRRPREGEAESPDGLGEEDVTLIAEGPIAEEPRSQYLSSVSLSPAQERFSTPGHRFSMQVLIYPDDLPDDMAFDTQTEAIVFKSTVKDRPQSEVSTSSGVSLSYRRKIFTFPKNITVAEVIEIGLERFGIVEGVVDGGDEIEDKSLKRRSSSRVRYTLHVEVGGKSRELSASSRIIEAYPRPPTLKPADARSSKRRSVDSAMLLGNAEDVSPEDPVFVLRRAVAYRHSTSRNRLSAPLDEIALQKFHRESVSSFASDGTISADDSKRQQSQPSQKEIIAAQREASRATQRAILSTQSNASHGVDVLLPGNAMIRSSRYEIDERTRYSYIDADGETYDVSDIIEEELSNDIQRTGGTDLLQSVKEVPSDKLDRVLTKIKDGKGNGKLPTSHAGDSLRSKRSSSPSLYSNTERDSIVQDNAPTLRTNTPLASAMNPKHPMSNIVSGRTASPLARLAASNSKYSTIHERQSSIASMLSDLQSGYRSPTPGTPPYPATRSGSVLRRPKPFIPKDDFGLSNMLAVIELGGSVRTPTPAPSDFVEEFFFGKKLDVEALHPAVQEIYADSFKQLGAMDAILDELLATTGHS